MKENFHQQILTVLDMQPASRRQLAERLGVRPGTDAYWEFTTTLSKMSEPDLLPGIQIHSVDRPLDIAINRKSPRQEERSVGKDTYLFYRKDQVEALERAGILGSKKRVKVTMIDFKEEKTKKALKLTT